MIEKYSADAVRYWAASTGPGKDAVISEEKVQAGARLATKLWNVARFSERFIQQARDLHQAIPDQLSPADRWILARLQALVRRCTGLLLEYDYAAAKSEIESFFWSDLADNYLEMCKQRLYGGNGGQDQPEGALYTLYHVLLTTLKLFGPFLPFITEEIYQVLFAQDEIRTDGTPVSLHTSGWPVVEPAFDDETALASGSALVEVATAVRRYKSDHNLSLGTGLSRVQLASADVALLATLQQAEADLRSITRSQKLEFSLKTGPLSPDHIGHVEVTIDP